MDLFSDVKNVLFVMKYLLIIIARIIHKCLLPVFNKSFKQLIDNMNFSLQIA